MSHFRQILDQLARDHETALQDARVQDARMHRQALADAAACRESRRVTRRTNRCGCYCCTVDRAIHGSAD
jgi:hypothetical protein